jgi:hypothetical protein
MATENKKNPLINGLNKIIRELEGKKENSRNNTKNYR